MKGNKNNYVNFTRLNFQLITQRMKQNMKNTIIWGLLPCYLVEIYRVIIRTCFPRLQNRGVLLSSTVEMGFIDVRTHLRRLLH